MLPVPS
jgi:hypothetical protein